jgi:MFS family permease
LLFYMPIVFVNYGSLSATEVGLAIGGGSIAGFIGNLIGGAMTDSPRFGRRITLLLAALLATAACGIAVIASDLTLLFLTNIMFGLSTGLYWTAADAAVMDGTEQADRQGAFSLLAVLDGVGFGAGTLGGGLFLTGGALAATGVGQMFQRRPTLLFGAGAIVFALMGLLFWVAMIETRPIDEIADADAPTGMAWRSALGDRRLTIYLLVNTLFITYMALVNSSLPLYFVNSWGTSESTISQLFTWGYVGLGALIQVPVVRAIAGFDYLRSLLISIGIWAVGFAGLAVASLNLKVISPSILELGLLSVFAVATVIYKPTSSAWIAALAPVKLRGIYTAIAYQCWPIAYFIGPILGGWAIDRPDIILGFWGGVAGTTLLGAIVLVWLGQIEADSRVD